MNERYPYNLLVEVKADEEKVDGEKAQGISISIPIPYKPKGSLHMTFGRLARFIDI